MKGFLLGNFPLQKAIADFPWNLTAIEQAIVDGSQNRHLKFAIVWFKQTPRDQVIILKAVWKAFLCIPNNGNNQS